MSKVESERAKVESSGTLRGIIGKSKPTSKDSPPFSPFALPLSALLDRTIIAMLFLLAAAVPHSIAGAQVAWGIALFAWALRFAFRPRPVLHRTPLDYLLLGFFILTGVAAFLSYAPDISIGKLRAASLFTIVYLIAQNVSSPRVLRLLVLTLLASSMVAVLFTFGERAVGRGVSVRGLAAESPLRLSGVQDGDTLLEVDGATLGSAPQLEDALRRAWREGRAARIHLYRFEVYLDVDVGNARLLEGAGAEAQLGIEKSSRGRDWRAAGFYGHYTTFAEVLQLIIALALGLLVAHVSRREGWTRASLLLAFVVIGLGGSLLLTVTRASWLACLVASFVVLAAGTRNRKVVIAGVLAFAIIVPSALFVLQQKRNVGFLDKRDGSTTWRMMVYREGVELLFSRPRHLLTGVGMDSIKRFRNEWGLFDHGRMPPGHFHSTPLQIAVERGLPALALWLTLLFVYGRTSWRLWRDERLRAEGGWVERGLALGALGGVCGFFTSGLVHYNLGDSEVAMVFYFIMGCMLVVERQTRQRAGRTIDASSEAW